ncbi:MAG: hypothetical protein SXV54_09720 [Chloroflexota bacterium]|nr:hypothetical protein [Chloroflexota bacterium]
MEKLIREACWGVKELMYSYALTIMIIAESAAGASSDHRWLNWDISFTLTKPSNRSMMESVTETIPEPIPERFYTATLPVMDLGGTF